MSNIVLNKMQGVATKMCVRWANSSCSNKRPWFEISGAAGTGKTTVVRSIMEELQVDMSQVLFMAFVGKATLALRLNGLPAQTIHSTIYEYVKVPKTDKETGNIIIKNGMPVMVNAFRLKKSLPEHIKYIVVDEGGMVDTKMCEHILSFGIPVIVLGDRNQLPPVFGNSLFLIEPDVTLNEIMRQAKDSPIIYLSQLAQHGIAIPYGTYGNDECLVIRKNELEDCHLKEANLVICGRNNTRDTINKYMRKNIYGIEDKGFAMGDKIICRQNNWEVTLNTDIALVNGLIGYVENIHRDTQSGSLIEIDFRPEFMEEEMFKRLAVDHKYPFMNYDKRKTTNTMYSDGIIFELGYCITCHLSQGSQSDTVLVYNETLSTSSFQRRWLYTAVTRAKKKLILVV